MTDKARGNAIKSRRLALGIKSVREFAEVTGIDRQALGKAENGEGSDGTYERAESWLDRFEEKTGHDELVKDVDVIRFKVEGVYGAKALVVEGPVDNPELLEQMIDRIMRNLRGNEGDDK